MSVTEVQETHRAAEKTAQSPDDMQVKNLIPDQK